MRTTLHSNVNAVSRCTKFIICFSENLLYEMEYRTIFMLLPRWRLQTFCTDFKSNLRTILYFLYCTRKTEFDALVWPKLNRTTGPYDDISNRRSYPVAVVFFYKRQFSPHWCCLHHFATQSNKGGLKIVEPDEEKKRQKFDKIINEKKLNEEKEGRGVGDSLKGLGWTVVLGLKKSFYCFWISPPANTPTLSNLKIKP